MGGCCSDLSGGRQAVGEVNKSSADAELETAAIQLKLGGTHGISSEVQIWLSAEGLRDRDIFSKSDPMAVVYLKRNGNLEEIGRTEVILNSLSPIWVKDVKVTYFFEEIQPLLIRLYDVDVKFHRTPPEKLLLPDQQFLGEAECLLSKVITSHGQSLTLSLREGRGSLTLKAEEMIYSKTHVELVLRCSEIDTKNSLRKTDPFLTISRLREDGDFVPIYQTEVKKNNLSPTWRPIRTSLQRLCNGDKDRPLRIECLSFHVNGRHELLGSIQASFHELQALAGTGASIEMKRMFDGHAASKQTGGKFYVECCSLRDSPTFLDYIMGGCELNFMVAVDFTASNGNPFQHDSLHFIDPSGKQNPYQAAIQAVGEVIEIYDTDKRFPAWGFGGRPIDGPVSHCFALNGNDTDAEADGIQGILRAYGQALKYVALAGPTLFAPVINMAASIANGLVSQEQQKYFILLIITDGVITDLQQTINAIVSASLLPLSILIVGVGGADFTEMEILDADKHRLTSSDGRLAARDIVQFVPMRSTKSVSFATTLLAELPRQLLEYMESRNIVPKGRTTTNVS